MGQILAMIRRVQNELRRFETEPPPGILAWPIGDSISNIEATIEGTKGTPYEGGNFKLNITIPQRYPLEPPKVRFITKMYHPNGDDGLVLEITEQFTNDYQSFVAIAKQWTT